LLQARSIVSLKSVVRVSGSKMSGFEKQKIIRNLVTLEKCLFLDDDCSRVISSKENIMRNMSPSLDYCIKLLHLGPDAFTQFIDL